MFSYGTEKYFRNEDSYFFSLRSWTPSGIRADHSLGNAGIAYSTIHVEITRRYSRGKCAEQIIFHFRLKDFGKCRNRMGVEAFVRRSFVIIHQRTGVFTVRKSRRNRY